MSIIYTATNLKNSVIRSAFSILLGVVLVLWPGTALNYIIMLIGILFLITGLISFSVSYKNREDKGAGGLLSFNGIGSIILGLLLISIPSTFAKIFMFILGFILVIAAVGQFVTLSAAKRFGYIPPLLGYIFPMLILLAGIVIIFDPFSSAESIFILFGVTAIFYGVTDIVSQYKVSKLRKMNEKQEQKKKLDGNEIEDAEYEEVKE